MSDNEYIEYVLQNYSNTIYRLAVSITKNKTNAEDIMQEVFVRLIKKKPVFENREHEKAWLLKVTVNCSKKLIYSAWNRHTVDLSEDMKFEDEEIKTVYDVVMKLPKKYVEVVHLFYYEDLPVKEISNILNASEGTIKSRLSRAREILRTKMKGGEWDE